MPRPEYKTVTIKKDLYAQVEKEVLTSKSKSVSAWVETVIKNKLHK